MAKKAKTTVDYERARSLLQTIFAKVEADLTAHHSPAAADEAVQADLQALFGSPDQSHREALLGCILARAVDRNINVRLPYVKQGPGSISLRTFDENVINPILQARRVPCSRGPYLAVFRRGWQFTEEFHAAVRDSDAYQAMLRCLSYLEALVEQADLERFLYSVLQKFVELREASIVPLTRLQRISLEQYEALISGLLASPSGGRFPVLLVVAAFRTIKELFELDWEIFSQGINVADAASGAGGDITIVSSGKTLMAVEITERPIDKARVVSTFNTKIAPAGIEDYLFFVTSNSPVVEAKQQACQYFAQGHEVNFLEIKDWIVGSLATMGKKGRATYNSVLLELLEKPDVPKTLKMAWNDQISRIVEG